MGYISKQRIFNRGISNDGKHFKKFSTLLAILNTEGTMRLALRGPQNKMILRFHLIPVRITSIKITATHHT